MLRIPKRVLTRSKSRRRPRKSLRSVVEHCRRLMRKGRGLEALKAARQGLEGFPHAIALQDVVRSTWKLMARSEFTKLEMAVEDQPGPESWDALLDHLVEHGDWDAAGVQAQRMLASHPREAWSLYLHGAFFALRSWTERVAEDGAIALASLQSAIDLEPEDHELRRLLIHIYERLGAVTSALGQVYAGQDEPGAPPEYGEIEERLSALEPETETEGELLRRIEEADGEPPPLEDGEEPAWEPELASQLAELSGVDGVMRVVMQEGTGSYFARDGEPFAPRDAEGGRGFEAMMTGFRRAASLSSKRMGIGAFQEAELVFEQGSVFAFQAGDASLMLERRGRGSSDAVEEEARMILGSWAVGGRS